MKPLGDQRCRLCSGNVAPQFSLRVLGKYDVLYSQCQQCRSLQSEPPYWLEEAYAANNLSNLDTGAAQRSLQNFAACWSTAKILGLRNVLDIGGGDGLLCRLLRDREINCFVRDKYAAPTYAQGFESPDDALTDMTVAFEVLEHYPNPSTELAELFSHKTQVILASTAIFLNQGEDWWYLAPDSGQHVFFYSKQALQMIAREYGYDMTMSGGYLLFTKPGRYGPWRTAVTKLFLKRRFRALTNALAAMLPARGVWKDHLFQIERFKSTGSPP